MEIFYNRAYLHYKGNVIPSNTVSLNVKDVCKLQKICSVTVAKMRKRREKKAYTYSVSPEKETK